MNRKESKVIQEFNSHKDNVMIDFVKYTIINDSHEGIYYAVKNEFKRFLQYDPDLTCKYCRCIIKHIFETIRDLSDDDMAEFDCSFIGKRESSYAFELDYNKNSRSEMITFLVDSKGV